MSAHKRSLTKEEGREPSPPKRHVAAAVATRSLSRAEIDALLDDSELFFSAVPRDVHTLLLRCLFCLRRGTLRDPRRLVCGRPIDIAYAFECLDIPKKHAQLILCAESDTFLIRAAPSEAWREYAIDFTPTGCTLPANASPHYRAPSGRLYGADPITRLLTSACYGDDVARRVGRDGGFDLPYGKMPMISPDETELWTIGITRRTLEVRSLTAPRRPALVLEFEQRIESAAFLSNWNMVVLCWDERGEQPPSRLYVISRGGVVRDALPLEWMPDRYTRFACVDGDDNLYFALPGYMVVFSLAARKVIWNLQHPAFVPDVQPIITQDGRMAVVTRHDMRVHIFSPQ